MRFLLILLAIALPASAATVYLSTGARCEYAKIEFGPLGSALVTCKDGAPPPPPPPVVEPPPTGCNAAAIQPALAWGEVRQQRAANGQVMAFPLAAPQGAGASVQFTQGQQPSTPAGVITEFTVSKCPGKIDSTAGACYYRGPFANYNAIDVYTRAGFNGCTAAGAGPWYVNVRWTYSTCPFGGGCGFSMQWAPGPW